MLLFYNQLNMQNTIQMFLINCLELKKDPSISKAMNLLGVSSGYGGLRGFTEPWFLKSRNMEISCCAIAVTTLQLTYYIFWEKAHSP